MNVTYRRYCNAKPLSDFTLEKMTAQISDFDDVGRFQLGHAVSLAAVACAVQQFVGFVFGMRFPRQMALGDAAMVAATAGMSGFMVGRRRWTVGTFAREARDETEFPTIANLAIASPVLGVRPDEALVAFVGHDDIAVETGRRSSATAARRPAAKRIAMPLESMSVCAAVAMRMTGLGAIFNFAYSRDSHRSLHDRLVRSRRSAPTLGGFVISIGGLQNILCRIVKQGT